MAIIYDYREFFRYVKTYNRQSCDVRENVAEAYFQVAALGLSERESKRRLLAYGAREVVRVTAGA